MIALMLVLEKLGESLFAWTWQAAILLGLAWVVTWLDREHRPAFRCRVWTAALVCVLVLPVMTAIAGSLSWTLEMPPEIRQVWVPAPGEGWREEADGMESNGDASLSIPAADSGGHADGPDASILFKSFAGVWLLGMLLSALRKLFAYIRLHRVFRHADAVAIADLTEEGTDWQWLGRPLPRALLSPFISTPMLFGWIRPVILLPQHITEWTTSDERTAMIRHECAHLYRRDHWNGALESVVRAVFFFHPLVPVACRNIGIERELSCDEDVLRLGSDAERYAETILKVAERVVVARSACAVFLTSADVLERRIDMLFRKTKAPERSIVLLPLISVMAGMVILFAVIQARSLDALSITISLPGIASPVLRANLSREVRPEVIESAPAPRKAAIETREQMPPDARLRELINEGRRMNAGQVRAAEQRLNLDANSIEDRMRLLAYYGPLVRQSDYMEQRREHVLWLIARHPESGFIRTHAILRPADPGYEEARAIWLQHTDRPDADAVVFRNASRFFEMTDVELAEEFLNRAEKAMPGDRSWPREIGDFNMRRNRGFADRRVRATHAVEAYERALRLETAEDVRSDLLAKLAESAFIAETWDIAASYALQAAASNHPAGVHFGNSILGELALRDGNVPRAEQYLQASVPGVADPISFSGPRLNLAAELLKRGERESVIRYLNQWAQPWPGGKDRIDQWTVLIANGLNPDFGANAP